MKKFILWSVVFFSSQAAFATDYGMGISAPCEKCINECTDRFKPPKSEPKRIELLPHAIGPVRFDIERFEYCVAEDCADACVDDKAALDKALEVMKCWELPDFDKAIDCLKKLQEAFSKKSGPTSPKGGSPGAR